jgi:hypothetical protein
MEQYSFESKNSFNDEDFLNHLEEAKKSISFNNNNVKFELEEHVLNKTFNSHKGDFKKFNIFHDDKLIGFLEAFKDNGNKYFIIYTNPLN